jgi:4-hydroxythreonine-4-phosphate dehydrogenase
VSDPRPLAISVGDPGGVGPEVSLRAAAQTCGDDRVLLFGDAAWLRERALELGIAAERLVDVDARAPGAPAVGTIGLCRAGAAWDSVALRHEPTAAGGAAQLASLDAALAFTLAGHARALVTSPMSKHAVNLAGTEFTGHTEHLARTAGLREDEVTMMFLGPRLRVGLVTTHLAIAEAPRAVTTERVLRAIRHTGEALLRLRGNESEAPRLLVTGLNPHAGEAGLFGAEDESAIAPAVQRALELPPFREGRVRLRGPIGAETAFRLAATREAHGVVAMLHDQATIASKLLDWTQAVNVTWGLPFVRTSGDHGVAYDAAAAGSADFQGMASALAMARRLCAR